MHIDWLVAAAWLAIGTLAMAVLLALGAGVMWLVETFAPQAVAFVRANWRELATGVVVLVITGLAYSVLEA